MTPPAVVDSLWALGGVIGVIVALLLVDLLLFARGRQATFAESVRWSVGWLVLGLAISAPMYLLDDADGAVNLKLLAQDVVHVGPLVSLAIVVVGFAIGITAYVLADRRDPAGAAERREAREGRLRPGAG